MSKKDRESRLSVTMLSVAFIATLGGVAATDLNKLPGVNNAGDSARDSGNISTISESFGQDSSDHFNDFEYANSNTLSTTNSVFFLYRNSSNKVTARAYFSNLLLLHNTTILVELYKINADAAQNVSALPAGSDYSFSELIADTPPVMTQNVAINELGDGEAVFEDLDVNAYYIARTKVSKNQYLYNRTLSFSTEPTTRPSFSVQSATVHNARILLNRQSLYIPQNQPDNVALAVGYRPQVSLGSSDQQPLSLQRVDRGLASYEPVVLQNLESGQNYEVALYAVQGMHVTRISDIKHFRTLTSFDRSESPIVRTVNMSDGVLEVEVGNIH